MKVQEGLERHSCAFLTSALDGGDGHLHAPAVLSAENEPLYILTSGLGGPHCRSGSSGEGKDLLTVLKWKSEHITSVFQAVALSLHRLRYPDLFYS